MSATRTEARRVRVAIVGAGGYSGGEAVSIILGHPKAEIVGLFGSERRGEGEDARPLSGEFPRFRGLCELPVRAASVEAIVGCGAEVALLGTPHGVSHALTPGLLDAGVRVVDLSAAFRLDDARHYPVHYGFEHARPDLLKEAVYGLPELHRADLPGARLIAAPGCYPTSAILPLAPLARAGAIAAGRPAIIDSVSGVSGAGRHPSIKAMFAEVSLQPYEVFTHRHTPEISRYSGVDVIFTPVLAAIDRGIVSTIHVEVAPGWDGARVGVLLRSAYGEERFVRLLPRGQWPSATGVRGTNFCDIAFSIDERRGHLILCSSIDNLVKGAAGQAIQAMNVAMGLGEATGLIPCGASGMRS